MGRLKEMVNQILEHPKCTGHKIYIKGKGNFRYDIYPAYKGNRNEFYRPDCEQELRDYLIHRFDAETVDGEEVDDKVSYLSLEDTRKNVIVAIDKDLDNTPGWHYNYVKKEFYWVHPEEADRNFYRQLLVGDRGDNIPGLTKVGPVRAEQILGDAVTPYDLYSKCVEAYDIFGNNNLERNAKLLWIRRQPEEMWIPPEPF